MPLQEPLSSFNFLVESVIYKGHWLCRAGFSECTGLEMTMQPRTIREGGNNGRAIHLPGPVSYGQITLRRGLTEDNELWNWFEEAQSALTLRRERLRADTTIVVQSADRSRQVSFLLINTVPVLMRAPSLNAETGGIAVEELGLAYEMMYRR